MTFSFWRKGMAASSRRPADNADTHRICSCSSRMTQAVGGGRLAAGRSRDRLKSKTHPEAAQKLEWAGAPPGPRSARFLLNTDEFASTRGSLNVPTNLFALPRRFLDALLNPDSDVWRSPSLLAEELPAAVDSPLAPKAPHFPAKAKSNIYLFMKAAPVNWISSSTSPG